MRRPTSSSNQKFLASGASRSTTHVHHSWMTVVRGVCEFLVPVLDGDPYGRRMAGRDDAGRCLRAEGRITPCDRRAHCLCSETFAVYMRGKHPPNLGNAVERRLQIAPVVGESDLTDIFVRRLFFDSPITESHQGPVPDEAEQARPCFLSGERGFPDVSRHVGVAPHAGTSREVFDPMPA